MSAPRKGREARERMQEQRDRIIKKPADSGFIHERAYGDEPPKTSPHTKRIQEHPQYRPDTTQNKCLEELDKKGPGSYLIRASHSRTNAHVIHFVLPNDSIDTTYILLDPSTKQWHLENSRKFYTSPHQLLAQTFPDPEISAHPHFRFGANHDKCLEELTNKDTNAYLIRESDSRPGAYVLHYVNKDGLGASRVFMRDENGKWCAEKNKLLRYDTLNQFLAVTVPDPDLAKHPNFRAAGTDARCKTLLTNQPEGSYLIRPSTSTPGGYTIHFTQKDGTVAKCAISKDQSSGKWFDGEKHHSSLKSLLKTILPQPDKTHHHRFKP